MKKVTQFILAFALFSLSLLTSCSSDDSEILPDYGTTTGDYFPLSENNKWWYENADSGEVTLMYVGTSLIFEGSTYYRVSDNDSQYDIPIWMTKKGATYFHKTEGVSIPYDNGVTVNVDEYEMIFFKDDLQVGQTWTEKINLNYRVYNGGNPQTVPATITSTGTILERDGTETIGGTTYTNVIKMRLEAVEKINSQSVNIHSEYWLAKDVGIIRESNTTSIDNITKTRYLTSYEFN